MRSMSFMRHPLQCPTVSGRLLEIVVRERLLPFLVTCIRANTVCFDTARAQGTQGPGRPQKLCRSMASVRERSKQRLMFLFYHIRRAEASAHALPFGHLRLKHAAE